MPLWLDKRDRLLPCSLRPCGWHADPCDCFPLYSETDCLNQSVPGLHCPPKLWKMFPFLVTILRVGLVSVRFVVTNMFSGVVVDQRTFPLLNPFTGFVRHWKAIPMSWLKSVALKSPERDPEVHASPSGLDKQYPALAEYMTSGRMPDGGNRPGSSLTVFCDQGKWKMVLKERLLGLDLWAVGDTFAEGLKALDSRLRDEVVEWRPATPVKKR